MERNVDAVTLPSLDVLEPQMENQLVEVLQKIDTQTSHQVVEVPKIFSDSSTTPCGESSAVGGTVGGSADDHVLQFSSAADCGANR